MKPEMKKLIIANLPYLLFVYLFGKLGQAYRLAEGIDLSQKLLHFADGCAAAFESAAPSFHPTDLLIGVAGAAALRLMVYCKGKNAKKYRKGVEYGSARWGGPKDIAPYAHLTLGMESKDGMSAADILHVRAGQNYLVEDFTRMERLRSDPVVLESLSRVAQEIGFDRVRPYVVENGSYKAMPDMPFTQWENPYFTVDPPAQEQGDTFTIYQLKGGPETRDYRFEAYESLQEAGLAVDRQNYDLIYTAPLDGKTTLEDIYRTFNLDRPADFTGHSLSVSDVVVLNRSGKEEAHYCDSFGFTPVPEFFLQREKQLTPRELLTGESIQTPRGSFLVTDMSREQLEAAGYGFHHQSEDGKYLIMGNGTDAFAIPAQQESPIKAAEMTTEQNYNMIDGVLNNAPTMSELEAKAKAGEQISLFDVAEAAKAEAQKPKQPQRPAQKQKKPSIRAQLKAAKEEQQKKPPQREKAQELEV